MPKRAPQERRTYFLTLVTADRRRIFQVESNAQLMLQLLQDDRKKLRYQLHAFVLMPDHLHLLITPAEDISLEKAIQFIKGGFSFRLKSNLPVWQNGYNEHRVTDHADFAAHLRYIEQNPTRSSAPPQTMVSSGLSHQVDNPSPCFAFPA